MARKTLKTMEYNYKKAPFFYEVFDFLIPFYNKTENLSDFNSSLIMEISKKIGITTNFVFSSGLKNISGHKDEKLVNICKKLKIDQYLSPQGSASYINKTHTGGEFVKNNIMLFYHNYSHPEYPQLFGKFVPYLGIYDLLFNVGFANALEILLKDKGEV